MKLRKEINRYLRKRYYHLILGVILAAVLAGCNALPFEIPWLMEGDPEPTLSPGQVNEITPTPEVPMIDEQVPAPITELTLWVPPEMDPALEIESSRLFAERLEAFSEAHDDLVINVRIKAASGVGGLLDALTATHSAALDIVPDLIVLSRPDLESAALKGIIFPLDGLTEIPDDTDWYGFARDMALIQGSTFGLPFAGDSLALVYRPSELQGLPNSWAGLIDDGVELVFPVESDQALFPLSLYLGEGGVIQDSQRRPVLEAEPLEAVFGLFQQGVESGAFPARLNQYQTSSQVWSAFMNEEEDLVVTWFSNYLKEGPADAAIMTLFPMNDEAVSLGTGLGWAVASLDESRRPVAVELAEFLVQAEYLAEWTLAAGYIPPRPTALETWQNQALRITLNQAAIMTRLRPANDTITSIGPILREGTRQVLQNQLSPAEAAQAAVDSFED